MVVGHKCWSLGLCAAALLLVAHGSYAERVWRFTHLNTEAGLPNNVVNSIAEDGRGFVWFGTQDGLARYDGKRLRNYRRNVQRPGSLSGNFIVGLYVDRQGKLWVATDSHGINRFDWRTERFTHYLEDPHKLGLDADVSVHYMLDGTHGELWLGTRKHGIIRLNVSSGTVSQFRANADQPNSLSDDHINGLYRDPHGTLWVATDAGLNRFRPASGDFDVFLGCVDQPCHGDNEIRQVAAAEGNKLWLVTNVAGLALFDPQSGQIRHYPTPEGALAGRSTALVRDASGGIWFGVYGGGLWHFGSDGVHTRIRARADWPQGLSHDSIRGLYLDAEQRLWVGTEVGVDMITENARQFEILRLPADPDGGGKNNLVNAVSAVKDGDVWLAVGSNVFVLPAADTLAQATPRQANSQPELGNVNALAADEHGVIWAASDAGLAKFDAVSRRLLGVEPLFPSREPGETRYRLLSVMVSRSGNIWGGANGAGVVIFDPKRGAVTHRIGGEASVPTHLSDGEVLAMAEGRDGVVWIGTWRGLNRYNSKSGAIRQFRHQESVAGSISHDTVSSIWIDAQERVWIGTFGGGVNRFLPESETFLHYTTEQGIADNGVYAITGDRQGHLWISTDHGVSRFDPDTQTAVSFHAEDGLQGNQFRWGAAATDAQGQIYFGGTRGLTRFEPGRVRVDQTPPIARVVAFRVNERELFPFAAAPKASPESSDGQVKLDYKSNLLEMEFAALRTVATGSVQYSYRLSGLHDDWVQARDGQASATYVQVPPGTYRFQLRARSANSPWSTPTQGLGIIITPSLWRNGWAYTVYAAFLLAVATLTFKERFRRRAAEQLAAQAIRESEERLSLALWGSRNQMWDWDAERKLMHRAHALPGFDLDEQDTDLAVDDILQTIHPDDRSACQDVIDSVMAGDSDSFQVAYRRRNAKGDWVWVMDRAKVVNRDPGGAPLRITGTMQDISDLKQQESALEALNRELEHRVAERSEQLQRAHEELAESEKLASLGTMVAGVAHEINTPLGISVTAASHVRELARKFHDRAKTGSLRRSDLDAFQTAVGEGSDLVVRNLQRAAELVRSFKQVAVDQSSERRRLFNVADALHDILTSLAPKIKKKHVTLEINCSKSLQIDSYPGAFYQVISNLVSNSLTHGFAGRESGKIGIDVNQDRDTVKIAYSDDGVGLDEATRRRVFEPFFTSRLGQGGGGLGMHVVHNLITHVLRGKIQCHSAPGAGAIFEFTIRLDPAQEASPEPVQPATG